MTPLRQHSIFFNFFAAVKGKGHTSALNEVEAIFSHLSKYDLIYQSTKHYEFLLPSGQLVDTLVCLKKQANVIL